MPRFQQGNLKSSTPQPGMPQVRSAYSQAKCYKEGNQSFLITRDLRLLHNLALRAHNMFQ
jgi:hypothetical protein